MPRARDVALAAVAFAAMEPVAYLAHRYVMHGPGWGWHASHHRPPEGRFERNDRFPVVFGAATTAAMALGTVSRRLRWLVPVGFGVTAYGATYAAVHDGWIHRRVPTPRRGPVGEHLADAHALHHRFGGEPYGMLAPVVPTSLRRRAQAPAVATPGRVGQISPMAARVSPSSHEASGGA